MRYHLTISTLNQTSLSQSFIFSWYMISLCTWPHFPCVLQFPLHTIVFLYMSQSSYFLYHLMRVINFTLTKIPFCNCFLCYVLHCVSKPLINNINQSSNTTFCVSGSININILIKEYKNKTNHIQKYMRF